MDNILELLEFDRFEREAADKAMQINGDSHLLDFVRDAVLSYIEKLTGEPV
jgi:hypothetical protein